MTRRRSDGFTLIELVVVVTILTLVAAAAVPTVAALDAAARYEELERRFDVHETALRAFAFDMVRAPATLDELASSSASGWLGPYLDAPTSAAPSVDPWGTALAYAVLAPNHVRLTSAGADRTFGGGDDVVREASLAPELRSYTDAVVAAVNRAVALHNAKPDGWTPLPSDVDALTAALVARGFLDGATDWTVDAYGRKLYVGPAPAQFVYAQNETAPAVAGGGRFKKKGGP